MQFYSILLGGVKRKKVDEVKVVKHLLWAAASLDRGVMFELASLI